MSRHDYSKYSNNKKHRPVDESSIEVPVSYQGHMSTSDAVVDVVSFETEVAAPDVEMVVETVDTVRLHDTVTGTVANCNKLNVRAEPDSAADVICVLDVATEIEVNVADSTDEWFSICTAAGVEGYCMRKFVNTRV